MKVTQDTAGDVSLGRVSSGRQQLTQGTHAPQEGAATSSHHLQHQGLPTTLQVLRMEHILRLSGEHPQGHVLGEVFIAPEPESHTRGGVPHGRVLGPALCNIHFTL